VRRSLSFSLALLVFSKINYTHTSYINITSTMLHLFTIARLALPILLATGRIDLNQSSTAFSAAGIMGAFARPVLRRAVTLSDADVFKVITLLPDLGVQGPLPPTGVFPLYYLAPVLSPSE
jgi:hypothetical protein